MATSNALVPIGTMLLLAMARRNLSVDEVARRTGMSTTQLHRTLDGRHEPLWSTVERIRLAIGAPASEIYEKTEVE